MTRTHGAEESKAKIIADRDSELKFDMKHARKLPDFNSKPAAVKLNTAAIIREEALILKKQSEEERVMKEFEENLRDDTEY
jgi:hypothetical protein